MGRFATKQTAQGKAEPDTEQELTGVEAERVRDIPREPRRKRLGIGCGTLIGVGVGIALVTWQTFGGIRHPTEGGPIGYAYHAVAGVTIEEAFDRQASKLPKSVRPEFKEAERLLQVGEKIGVMGSYDLAAKKFAGISNNPALTREQRGFALFSQGATMQMAASKCNNPDEAKERARNAIPVLKKFIEENQGSNWMPEAHISLGTSQILTGDNVSATDSFLIAIGVLDPKDKADEPLIKLAEAGLEKATGKTTQTTTAPTTETATGVSKEISAETRQFAEYLNSHTFKTNYHRLVIFNTSGNKITGGRTEMNDGLHPGEITGGEINGNTVTYHDRHGSDVWTVVLTRTPDGKMTQTSTSGSMSGGSTPVYEIAGRDNTLKR